MDTDDCRMRLQDRNIFPKNCLMVIPLKDYIVPLYNDTNLEDVMIKSWNNG